MDNLISALEGTKFSFKILPHVSDSNYNNKLSQSAWKSTRSLEASCLMNSASNHFIIKMEHKDAHAHTNIRCIFKGKPTEQPRPPSRFFPIKSGSSRVLDGTQARLKASTAHFKVQLIRQTPIAFCD